MGVFTKLLRDYAPQKKTSRQSCDHECTYHVNEHIYIQTIILLSLIKPNVFWIRTLSRSLRSRLYCRFQSKIAKKVTTASTSQILIRDDSACGDASFQGSGKCVTILRCPFRVVIIRNRKSLYVKD